MHTYGNRLLKHILIFCNSYKTTDYADCGLQLPKLAFFSGLHRNKTDPTYELLHPFLVTVFFTFYTKYTNYTVYMNSITELVNLQTPHLTVYYLALFESVAYFRIEVLWHTMQYPAQWTAWPQQILQNFRNHLSSNTLSHPRRLESSATMLQGTWIWHSAFYHHIVKGLTVALNCLVKGNSIYYFLSQKGMAEVV